MSSPAPITIKAKGKEYYFPAAPPSDAKNEKYRKEEDETFAGPDALEEMRCRTYPELWENLGISTWQGWLMHANIKVAEYYDISKNRVLENWVSRYGAELAFETEPKREQKKMEEGGK